MKKQMIVRVEPELKEKFERLARMEGKNTSQKIRELMNSYTVKHDPVAIIDDLWLRISTKIEKGGFSESDIDKVIKQVRNSE